VAVATAASAAHICPDSPQRKHPTTATAVAACSDLFALTAEAAVAAPHALPGPSAVTAEKIHLAAGTTDKDEEATIGDPGEQATVGARESKPP